MAFVAVSLPPIALVVLSIAAFVVSIVALLFVTVPMYMLLRALTRTSRGGQSDLVEDADPASAGKTCAM